MPWQIFTLSIIVSVFWVIGAFGAIVKIGKPREPSTPGHVITLIFMVAFTLFAIWVR